MVTEAVLKEGLATLADALPAGKVIEGPALKLWGVILRDLSDHDFRVAVVEYCRRPGKTFMPSPGEILEAAKGNEGDQAEALWMAVEAAIARHGRYASVSFHPAANAAIRSLGGWQKLCESTADEMVFRRKDFLTSVRTWLRHSPGEQGGHLVGLVEADHVRRQLPWGGEVKLCGPGAVAPAERVEALPEGGNVVRLVSAIAAKTGGGR